ncbi:MAG: glycoside hydrolase family 3 protein [Acidimicrobiia bacterium]|nr:glycoside hydrolase family 3 protein [Acidimicrobiia bacterium]
MLALLAGLFAAGCGTAGSAAVANNNAPRLQSEPAPAVADTAGPEAATATVAEPEPDPGPERAEEILSDLSLEEKVGQLFMPVVHGSDAITVTATEARSNETVFGYRTPSEIIEGYKLGGVMYLRHNVVTADQVGALSAGLQSAARSETGIGLLVAIDQEGGRVSRLTDGVTIFPPAAILSGDGLAVEEAGYLTGRQVSGQGINVVLAPVADLTTPGTPGAIGNRSYGDDPLLVADMVRAAVGGLQGSGVAAAVKHWPGHGPTTVDSHVSLPVLDITRAVWEERERVPFEAAIAEDVAIVLVGHLALPAVDPAGEPATVSPVLIDEELRDQLGFEGVVMTDALNMGAVSDLDQGDLAIRSVAAGADVLLYPSDLPTAYGAVLDAVRTGELTQYRLDQAVLRVLRLKAQLGLLPMG